jgi:hypothetical protein
VSKWESVADSLVLTSVDGINPITYISLPINDHVNRITHDFSLSYQIGYADGTNEAEGVNPINGSWNDDGPEGDWSYSRLR